MYNNEKGENRFMELKNILSGIEGLKSNGNLDIDIKNIKNNSKDVKSDDLFIAIKGFDFDGHKCIKESKDNGAKVIVAQEN